MKKALFAASLIATACGQQNEQSASMAAYSEEFDTPMSMSVAEESDLPECSVKNNRQLVYVETLGSFFSCKNKSWVEVLAPVGAKGDRGEKGEKGDAGETGANGIDGTNGSDGQDGTDGTDAAYVGVWQGELAIGSLKQLDASTNVASIVHTSGLRLQVSVTGAMWGEAQQFFYSGANCTGEMRMAIGNGRFYNTAYNPVDATWYKATQRPLARFDYASSSRFGGACSNGSNFITTSFTTEPASELSTFTIGTALFFQ